MKLIINNPFRSKDRAYKTLAFGYFFSLMFLLIGFGWLLQYREHGYYVDGHAGIAFHGDSALVTIIGVIGVALILLVYTVYLTFCVIIYIRKQEFDSLKVLPEYVICFKCLKPRYAKEAPYMKCPDCGNTVEDLEGFYERHPELKNPG